MFDTPLAQQQDPRMRAIATYLGKRYLVSPDAVERFVQIAFDAGREVSIDPLLIVAVMAVESRFNPIAESTAGAQGLMQLIPKYHEDKLPESHADPSFPRSGNQCARGSEGAEGLHPAQRRRREKWTSGI